MFVPVKNSFLAVRIYAIILFIIETESRPAINSDNFAQNVVQVVRLWEDLPQSHHSILVDSPLPNCPSPESRDNSNCPNRHRRQTMHIPNNDRFNSLSPFDYCINHNATRFVLVHKKNLELSTNKRSTVRSTYSL